MGVIDTFFAESILSRRAVLDNSISVANLAKTKAAERRLSGGAAEGGPLPHVFPPGALLFSRQEAQSAGGGTGSAY